MEAELLDTITAFYDAVTQPDAWTRAVEQLRVLFNAEGANFGIYDPSSPTPIIAANCGAWNDKVMAAYVNDFMPLDPAPARYGRLPAGKVVSSAQLFPADFVRTSVFCNEFLRPIRATECLAGRLVDIPNGLSLVSLHRDHDRNPFTPEDARRLDILMPHLARAFQTHRLLARQGVELAALGAAVDRIATGLLITDTLGAVVHVNAAARDVAARRDGLTLTREGLLRAQDAGADARLAMLHRDVLSGGAGGIVRVPRNESVQTYGVLVAPLPRDFPISPVLDVGRAGALFAISDPDRATPSAAALLTAAFGLTPRGAELVAALANGEDLGDYAEQKRLSIHTARFHLKAVFAQMGVHSQAQLVRLAVRALVDLSLR